MKALRASIAGPLRGPLAGIVVASVVVGVGTAVLVAKRPVEMEPAVESGARAGAVGPVGDTLPPDPVPPEPVVASGVPSPRPGEMRRGSDLGIQAATEDAMARGVIATDQSGAPASTILLQHDRMATQIVETAAAPTGLTGDLWVSSGQYAEVWEGQRRLGRTNERIADLPCGPHDLKLVRAGLPTEELCVVVLPNVLRQVEAPAIIPAGGTTTTSSVRPRRGHTLTYYLEPNETLADVAKDHGISVGELLKLNGIQDPGSVKAFDPILVPD